jgi:hypothetical protein
MKTLDEVIKAYEICLNINETSCRGCPYTEFNAEGKWACSLCGDCTEDALHYLKMLKDILDPLKNKKALHEITCPQCNSVIAILLPESNEPLTWDELQKMEDKPVWIQEGDHGYWIIIDNFSVTSYGYHWLNSAEGCLEKEYMGISWQAYRKEKE